MLYKLTNKPKLRIDYETDEPSTVTYTERRLTDGTVYHPVFEFTNNSEQTCTVRIWWIGRGGLYGSRRVAGPRGLRSPSWLQPMTSPSPPTRALKPD